MVPGEKTEHGQGTWKHEAIDGLFAGIQPTVGELRCQKVLGGTFQFGRKENTVKARGMMIICMPAVVQATQTTPLSVFMSNTRDSSGVNPEDEHLGGWFN